MTALVLMMIEDPAWPEWMKRALDRPEPEDLVGRRSDMRVASEVGRSAILEGRRDLLDAAARRFAVLARRWPSRDTVLEDESLNPVALAAQARIADGDLAGAVALLLESGPGITDRIPGTLEQLRLKADPKTLAKEALARGADPRALGEFLLQHLGRSETAVELLEKSRTHPDAGACLRLACLRFRMGHRERGLALAREGLSSALDRDVLESLTLLVARVHIQDGKAPEALDLLGKLAEPVRVAHVAELLDAAGDDERAIKLYGIAEALGGRPHIQLARLYQRTGRHEEALQRYERDLKSGSLAPAWPPDEDLGALPMRPGAASTSREGRAQMLKLLGR